MTKKTNFKKHLLTSASVLAFGAFASSYANATNYAVDTTIAADPAAVANYTADVILTINDAVDLANAAGVTTATTSTGTLTFSGSTTVTGPVGLTGTRLKAINAGVAGKTVTFNEDVFADTLTVSSTGTVAFGASDVFTGTYLKFSADGVLNVADAGGVVAAVSVTTTNTGTIDFANAGTLTGNVGSSSLVLKELKIASANAAKTVTATGDIFATTVTIGSHAGSTLSLADGSDVTGNIVAAGNAAGVVTASGDSTLTGLIGVTGTRLGILNGGAAGKTLTLAGGDVFATVTNVTSTGTIAVGYSLTGTTLNFAGDGTVTLASGKSISANITAATTSNGTLTLAGSNTITGNVGATAGRELKLINLGGTGTNAFSGTVDALDISFTADGTMTIADNQTLQVDAQATTLETATNNTGTVSFLGTATVGTATADLGTSAKLLKAVNILAGSGSAGTDTVTSTGSIYATSVVLGDHADDVVTLSIGAGETLQAAVTTFANGDGTLTFAGAGTMTGQIGTSTAELLKINVGAGAVTFDSNTYATQLDFAGDNTLTVAAGKSFLSSNTTTAAVTAGGGDNTGTLTFAGSTTISNIIGTTAAELKAINFNAGTATIGKSINAVTTTVATDATATFSAAASHDTDIVTVGSGTVDLGSVATTLTGAGTATGNVTFGGTSSTLGVTVTGGDNNDSGSLTAAGTVNLADGKVVVAVSSSEFIATGKTYLIATAGTLTAGGVDGIVISDNSWALDFTATTNATTLTLTSSRAHTFQSTATGVNGQGVGTALETIQGTGDTALDTIQGTLNGYTTAAQIESALKTLAPTNAVSGATTQAVVAASDAALGTVESHMEVARAEMSGTGVATGGKMNSSGVWGEVFGTASDQSWRKGVDGYQADTGGFSIGADTAVNSQTRVGAAFAYANTDAEGATVGTGGTNSTQVDSYQGSVYGTYDMGKVYYEGLAAFTFNSFDTDRNDFLGNARSASFDGQQYSAKATAGYKVDLQGGLKVTPFVSAQYTFITQDDYTETGTGSALHVSTDDINVFKTGLGTKLAYPIVDGGTTYTPRLSAAWYYDLVGDEVETTSNFVSVAGTTFNSKGADVAQSAFRLGAGLDVLAQDNVTVSLDYNWDTKESYDAHTGQLKARFEF